MACSGTCRASSLQPAGFPLPTVTATDTPARHGLVSRLVRLLILWDSRWRQRQDLVELDDHMLADIGISREEARREASNPFWR